MTARLDGELSPRRAARLDRHLAGCEACRVEAQQSAGVFDLLSGLEATAEVPARLEQNTLRAVRILAADERERAPGLRWERFRAMVLPAASAAAVMLLAVRATPDLATPPGAGSAPAVRPSTGGASSRPARARAPKAVNAARRNPPPVVGPPPELAAAPDLFMELHILRNLEKLEHYERIRTTTVDPDAVPGADERSDG